MRATYILLLASLLYLNTLCAQVSVLPEGLWRGEIALQKTTLPFNFEVQKHDKGGQAMYLINAEERILLDEFSIVDDSLFIPMHIFDAAFRVKLSEGNMRGYFYKYIPGNFYQLPFSAISQTDWRFKKPASDIPPFYFGGTWEVTFTDETGDVTDAIGIFEQQDTRVTGTFLTTTGDYRYLQGIATADSLLLSAFDGEHLYRFQAAPLGSSTTLEGVFYSGRSYKARWVAKHNPDAKLPDANTLTFLKEGYDKLSFSFPDLEGRSISLDDEAFRGKVVIVQLLGSWCPNCMDETAFLSKYYNSLQNKNLAIVGLAYERNTDFEAAKVRLGRMVNRFEVKYPILLAGSSDKKEAAATLPMLNHVLAFPTTIFIDKQGKVRKIHTGFSGPGTGKYYEEFVDEFSTFVSQLLRE